MNDVPTEAGPLRVLFVCTGNTCRSPMAEVLARRGVRDRGWEHVEVGSAGVAAFGGAPASGGALRAAARHGLDLSGHAATLLTPGLVEEADLILTMSVSHLARARELGAGSCSPGVALRHAERERAVPGSRAAVVCCVVMLRLASAVFALICLQSDADLG